MTFPPSTAYETNDFSTPAWWKEAVVYQIYPASFQSQPGNKTGWGTIKGITSRLDYLRELGVDVVWVSPIFKSPQADMGYDIADYKEIDHRYGTLEDVDELIRELKKRDMKFVVDIVVNHTSDQHAWFKESRSSKTNNKRDWYHWQKPKGFAADGTPEPPNNWAQVLGEANSAWNYDETTGEFYLGLFTPEQPDLNWENPAVREAVWDVMLFWLQRGASGFRLDVINFISKVPGYPEAKAVLDKGHRYQPGLEFFVNGPKLHDYLREMHSKVLSKYDTITVGEMPDVRNEDEIVQIVSAKSKELRMIFVFDLVDIDKPNVRMALKPWAVREMKSIISRWQRTMIERDGWNTVFIENHDNPRSVSRYADDSDEWREKGAMLLAMMQTTLGGTLFVYQGEEIGIRNAPKDWPIEEFKDIETINYWNKVEKIYADDPEKRAYGRKVIDMKARDHARTPMQWNGTPNAGFCDADVKSWMRVMDDYQTVNTEAQMGKTASGGSIISGDQSVWGFWQAMLRLRKENADVFVYGDFHDLTPDHPNLYAYGRKSKEGSQWLVLLNFSGEDVVWDNPWEVESWHGGNYANFVEKKPRSGKMTLRPWESVMGRCC